MKYTVQHGNMVLRFIHENGYPTAKLIGSLGNGKESYHDIDILIWIRGKKKKQACADILINLLLPEKTEAQDWGGVYYTNTIYGDVDIFFTDKDFDF